MWWLALVGCAWIGGDEHRDQVGAIPLDVRIAPLPDRLTCEPITLDITVHPQFGDALLEVAVSADGQPVAEHMGPPDRTLDGRPGLQLTLPELPAQPGDSVPLEVSVGWPLWGNHTTVALTQVYHPAPDLQALTTLDNGVTELPIDHPHTRADYLGGAVSVGHWPTLGVHLEGSARWLDTDWSAELYLCPAGQPLGAACERVPTSRDGARLEAQLGAYGEGGCEGQAVDLILAVDDLPCEGSQQLQLASDLMLRTLDCDGDGLTAYGFGGLDCDDFDPDMGVVYYTEDFDGDGVGGNTQIACNPPSADWIPIIPGVTVTGDCAPGNPAILGPDPWYPDLDGDGLGAEPAVLSCTPLPGHVAQAGDCDDTDRWVTEAVWYRDDDGDGVGSPDLAPHVGCEAPATGTWARNSAWDCDPDQAGPAEGTLNGAPIPTDLAAALLDALATGEPAELCAGPLGLTQGVALDLATAGALHNASLERTAHPDVLPAHRRIPWVADGRALDLTGAGALTLDGFYLRQGNTTPPVAGDGGCVRAGELTLIRSGLVGCAATGRGGAIYAQDLTLQQAEIRRAEADEGGAIYADTVQLAHTTLRQNLAQGDGGALSARQVTGLGDSELRDNQATRGGGLVLHAGGQATGLWILDNQATEQGGGVDVRETGALAALSLIGNQAGSGGAGIACAPCVPPPTGTALSLLDLLVENQLTDGPGAGVWVQESGPGGEALLTLQDAALRLNQSVLASGGGLAVEGSSAVSLSNISFEDNYAGIHGGGLAAEGSGVWELEAVAVTGNLASGEGGGLYLAGALDVRMDAASSVEANEATGSGGGLRAAGTVQIELGDATQGTRFEQNQAEDAGAMLLTDDVLLFGNAALNENLAGTAGAALWAYGSPEIHLQDCSILDNASQRGVVALEGGSLSLDGCSVHGNTVEQFAVVVIQGAGATAALADVSWADNTPADLQIGGTVFTPAPATALCSSTSGQCVDP